MEVSFRKSFVPSDLEVGGGAIAQAMDKSFVCVKVEAVWSRALQGVAIFQSYGEGAGLRCSLIGRRCKKMAFSIGRCLALPARIKKLEEQLRESRRRERELEQILEEERQRYRRSDENHCVFRSLATGFLPQVDSGSEADSDSDWCVLE